MVTRAVLAYNLAYIKPRPRHAVGGALSDNGVCPSVAIRATSCFSACYVCYKSQAAAGDITCPLWTLAVI